MSSAIKILARQYDAQTRNGNAEEPVGNEQPAPNGLAAQEANTQVNEAQVQALPIDQADVASLKVDNIFVQEDF